MRDFDPLDPSEGGSALSLSSLKVESDLREEFVTQCCSDGAGWLREDYLFMLHNKNGMLRGINTIVSFS